MNAAAATMGVFIYLDDVDRHYAVAKAAGAKILHPPKDPPYGAKLLGERSRGASAVFHIAARRMKDTGGIGANPAKIKAPVAGKWPARRRPCPLDSDARFCLSGEAC